MPISQELLQSASLNKWTLNFKNGQLEGYYRQYASPRARHQVRVALVIGVLMFVFHGLLDALIVHPDVPASFWYIRAGLIMVGFLMITISYHKKFVRIHQLAIGGAGLVAGFGMIAMLLPISPEVVGHYYAGLIMIIVWCHNFSGLRFINATLVGMLIFLAFTVIFIINRSLPLAAMVSYIFFMFAVNVFGMISSYMTEERQRALFLREKELDRERILHKQRALHDPLTRLPNRRLLVDRIDQAINHASRNNELCAGLFLDLDNFKPINDTYGHAVGDLVLREIVKRLKRAVREADTLARLGGDEFFVLAKGLQNEDDAKILAAKLQKQIEKPIFFSTLPPITGLSVSIGICMFPYNDNNAQDVIHRADQAMYQVKHGGKAGVAVAQAA